MLNKFSECAGLSVNLDKTEAIWLGSRRSCHEQLLPDKHLSWNFSGKFKLLDITFNLSESDKTLRNFAEKVQSVKNILNLWSLEMSLEMPVPSQGHYGFHSFPVVCLYTYEF